MRLDRSAVRALHALELLHDVPELVGDFRRQRAKILHSLSYATCHRLSAGRISRVGGRRSFSRRSRFCRPGADRSRLSFRRSSPQRRTRRLRCISVLSLPVGITTLDLIHDVLQLTDDVLKLPRQGLEPL